MLRGVCLAAAMLCLASALPQIENLDRPGRIPGEYLVVLKPTSQAQKASYVQDTIARIQSISASISLINKFDALESPILHFQAEEEAISQAFQIPDVVTIEANVFEKMIEECASQGTGSTYWGLTRISSRSNPSYSGARHNYRVAGGYGVRLYVLDTGIRTTHTDFAGGRAVFGTNTIGGSNSDVHSHGTHCAGTAGGRNSGVAKGTTVVAVKVLGDDGGGSTSSVVDGINWTINDLRNRGRGVISMSLGGGFSNTMNSAVNSAVSANIPCVSASGNGYENACNSSPGSASGSITVGATNRDDQTRPSSNYGTCVDILAPGDSIRSASNSDDSSYINKSGTSMACPHVAGAVAVYLQRNPSATPSQVRSALISSSSKGYIDLGGTTGTPNNLLYENC